MPYFFHRLRLGVDFQQLFLPLLPAPGLRFIVFSREDSDPIVVFGVVEIEFYRLRLKINRVSLVYSKGVNLLVEKCIFRGERLTRLFLHENVFPSG